MYEIKEYDYLFSIPTTGSELFDIKSIRNHRMKTITSGPIVKEYEIYRIWDTKPEMRRARGEITPAEQKEVNRRNAEKSFKRKANTNFGPEDLAITLTNDGIVTEEQASRNVRNFLRCVSRRRKKMGLPELKYMYVIEWNATAEPLEDNKPVRVHHHVIMSGMDRDIVESLWKHGYANARRLQLDENGISALASYMMKDPKGKKRWCCSKNLKQPTITIADKKISPRQVEKILRAAEIDGKAIFEKFTPGYAMTHIEVKRSQRIEGVYIYVKMHKIPESDNRTPSAHTRTRTRAQQYQIRKGAQKNGTGNG
jgi:hypothetical protein